MFVVTFFLVVVYARRLGRLFSFLMQKKGIRTGSQGLPKKYYLRLRSVEIFLSNPQGLTLTDDSAEDIPLHQKNGNDRRGRAVPLIVER